MSLFHVYYTLLPSPAANTNPQAWTTIVQESDQTAIEAPAQIFDSAGLAYDYIGTLDHEPTTTNLRHLVEAAQANES